MRHHLARRLTTALAGVLLIAAALVATPFVSPAAAANGDVIAFGGVPDLGPPPVNDVVDLAASPSGNGYWTVNRSGRVDAFGDAPFLGDVRTLPLIQPIVAIAAHPSGAGYWLAAADGGVFTFGQAAYYGSMGGIRLNQPVVGMAGHRSGQGYWLVAADGGIFTFGVAPFLGSMGATRLNQPVTAMAATADGNGYWMFAGDGGVFTFGSAAFLGSLGGGGLTERVVAGSPTADGRGYWLAGDRGGVYTFGSLGFFGSVALPSNQQATGIAARPDGSGYWMAVADRPVPPPSGTGGNAPPNSGSGRRIIYGNSAQRVWLVNSDNTVHDTYLVSGKRNTPAPGTYSVYSKSTTAWAGHDGITMKWMVRFARGQDLAIGFHAIPRWPSGNPLQSEAQLGTYRSSGCVRQADVKARALFDWAPIGTKVVVLA